MVLCGRSTCPLEVLEYEHKGGSEFHEKRTRFEELPSFGGLFLIKLGPTTLYVTARLDNNKQQQLDFLFFKRERSNVLIWLIIRVLVYLTFYCVAFFDALYSPGRRDHSPDTGEQKASLCR
jgi:hypothetical protein